jgi:hypothetical protein
MNHLTQIALATALAACSLIAGPANTAAATANNAVLILEPAPCGGIEVVVFYDIINIDEHINVGNLTASNELFIAITGQSFQPTFPAAAANSHLSAVLLNSFTETPAIYGAPRKVGIENRATAANIITVRDRFGFGAPRKFPSKVPVPAGFSANPSLSNMTWSLATKTALMSPAAG